VRPSIVLIRLWRRQLGRTFRVITTAQTGRVLSMRLEGRSVLLTGATGGIGCAIARELAARSGGDTHRQNRPLAGAARVLGSRDEATEPSPPADFEIKIR
jgi:hypothetical protein